MGKPDESETGQLCFGNPREELECPVFVVALIKHLAWYVGVIEWNRRQKEFDCPTQNTGSRWSNDTFAIRAYYWGDNEAEAAAPNFRCGDVEVRWYKHLGRGTTINRDVSPGEMVSVFNKCWDSLDRQRGADDAAFWASALAEEA